jgi:hypothetical protein
MARLQHAIVSDTNPAYLLPQGVEAILHFWKHAVRYNAGVKKFPVPDSINMPDHRFLIILIA